MRQISDDLFCEVGKNYGKSGEEIKGEIKFMIEDVLAHADAETKRRWSVIPCKGEIPTPEEVVAYFVEVDKQSQKRPASFLKRIFKR